MSGAWKALRRWVKGTSNRTFVLWPIALLLLESVRDGGWPEMNPWALPLLVWGYMQYRLVGRLRTARGGGGPGMSNPPERLVTNGPYRLTRNPMYLGHLIFFLGLALLFSGPAWLVFVAHLVWFDRRARRDESHMHELFGSDYDAYRTQVKRWVPGIY